MMLGFVLKPRANILEVIYSDDVLYGIEGQSAVQHANRLTLLAVGAIDSFVVTDNNIGIERRGDRTVVVRYDRRKQTIDITDSFAALVYNFEYFASCNQAPCRYTINLIFHIDSVSLCIHSIIINIPNSDMKCQEAAFNLFTRKVTSAKIGPMRIIRSHHDSYAWDIDLPNNKPHIRIHLTMPEFYRLIRILLIAPTQQR